EEGAVLHSAAICPRPPLGPVPLHLLDASGRPHVAAFFVAPRMQAPHVVPRARLHGPDMLVFPPKPSHWSSSSQPLRPTETVRARCSHHVTPARTPAEQEV